MAQDGLDGVGEKVSVLVISAHGRAPLPPSVLRSGVHRLEPLRSDGASAHPTINPVDVLLSVGGADTPQACIKSTSGRVPVDPVPAAVHRWVLDGEVQEFHSEKAILSILLNVKPSAIFVVTGEVFRASLSDVDASLCSQVSHCLASVAELWEKRIYLLAPVSRERTPFEMNLAQEWCETVGAICRFDVRISGTLFKEHSRYYLESLLDSKSRAQRRQVWSGKVQLENQRTYDAFEIISWQPIGDLRIPTVPAVLLGSGASSLMLGIFVGQVFSFELRISLNFGYGVPTAGNVPGLLHAVCVLDAMRQSRSCFLFDVGGVKFLFRFYKPPDGDWICGGMLVPGKVDTVTGAMDVASHKLYNLGLVGRAKVATPDVILKNVRTVSLGSWAESGVCGDTAGLLGDTSGMKPWPQEAGPQAKLAQQSLLVKSLVPPRERVPAPFVPYYELSLKNLQTYLRSFPPKGKGYDPTADKLMLERWDSENAKNKKRVSLADGSSRDVFLGAARKSKRAKLNNLTRKKCRPYDVTDASLKSKRAKLAVDLREISGINDGLVTAAPSESRHTKSIDESRVGSGINEESPHGTALKSKPVEITQEVGGGSRVDGDSLAGAVSGTKCARSVDEWRKGKRGNDEVLLGTGPDSRPTAVTGEPGGCSGMKDDILAGGASSPKHTEPTADIRKGGGSTADTLNGTGLESKPTEATDDMGRTSGTKDATPTAAASEAKRTGPIADSWKGTGIVNDDALKGTALESMRKETTDEPRRGSGMKDTILTAAASEAERAELMDDSRKSSGSNDDVLGGIALESKRTEGTENLGRGSGMEDETPTAAAPETKLTEPVDDSRKRRRIITDDTLSGIVLESKRAEITDELRRDSGIYDDTLTWCAPKSRRTRLIDNPGDIGVAKEAENSKKRENPAAVALRRRRSFIPSENKVMKRGSQRIPSSGHARHKSRLQSSRSRATSGNPCSGYKLQATIGTPSSYAAQSFRSNRSLARADSSVARKRMVPIGSGRLADAASRSCYEGGLELLQKSARPNGFSLGASPSVLGWQDFGTKAQAAAEVEELDMDLGNYTVGGEERANQEGCPAHGVEKCTEKTAEADETNVEFGRRQFISGFENRSAVDISLSAEKMDKLQEGIAAIKTIPCQSKPSLTMYKPQNHPSDFQYYRNPNLEFCLSSDEFAAALADFVTRNPQKRFSSRQQAWLPSLLHDNCIDFHLPSEILFDSSPAAEVIARNLLKGRKDGKGDDVEDGLFHMFKSMVEKVRGKEIRLKDWLGITSAPAT